MSGIEKFTKGQSPYGFQWRSGALVLAPKEAEVRARAFELFLKSKSMGAVARCLNKEGHLTRRGGNWSDVQVARILSCPSAIGRYELNRSESDEGGKRTATASEERVSIECEPIVSREVWDQVGAILNEKRQRGGVAGVTDLFVGLAWCGCGERMRLVKETQKLVCSGCQRKIPVRDLESIFVEDFVQMAAGHPTLSKAISTQGYQRECHERLLKLNSEYQAATHKRAGVEKMLVERAITSKRFDELHAPLEKSIRDLEGEISRLEASMPPPTPGHDTVTLSDWKKNWFTWPQQKRRQIIATFVSRIVIGESDIEIAYLLSDSPPKDPTKPQQITSPTNQTPTSGPVYIRLPKPGELCTITGLARSKLNELILPNERNNFSPPVASKSIRKPGQQRGVRLILLESLMAFLQSEG